MGSVCVCVKGQTYWTGRCCWNARRRAKVTFGRHCTFILQGFFSGISPHFLVLGETAFVLFLFRVQITGVELTSPFFSYFPNWSVAFIFIFLPCQQARKKKRKMFTLDWLFPPCFDSSVSFCFPLYLYHTFYLFCFFLIPFRLLLEFIFSGRKFRKCIFYLYSWKKRNKTNSTRGEKPGSVSLDRYITVGAFGSFNSRGAFFLFSGVRVVIFKCRFFFFLLFFFVSLWLSTQYISSVCVYTHGRYVL